ncbi:DUF2752 domain-containing protein [Novipirellula aureliae]|uniref:DUF2752 domain-containing protein n=1 Tax=Novipirellula aureliae TaxID=2527966 RepID=UPI0011B58ECC|nr:DUF2752 domain-containing protein [Novipirellula aureliae]
MALYLGYRFAIGDLPIWMPKCLFHQWTGFHCPGCGGTRAVSALFEGNFVLAVRNNPLLILGTPLIGLAIYRQHRRELAGGKASPRLVWTLFILFVAYFALRNIPSPTTSPLAPVPEIQDSLRPAMPQKKLPQLPSNPQNHLKS